MTYIFLLSELFECVVFLVSLKKQLNYIVFLGALIFDIPIISYSEGIVKPPKK